MKCKGTHRPAYLLGPVGGQLEGTLTRDLGVVLEVKGRELTLAHVDVTWTGGRGVEKK